MGDKKLKEYLRQSLQQEIHPERMEETIKLCKEIMRENKAQEEPRTGFVQFLSDVFRFEGIPIFGLQAAVLLLICLAISSMPDIPKYMPVFMPLFVLAVMPAVFKCQYYGMSEIEAATRASGAQVILAKLILAGAADLMCITALICVEVYLRNNYGEIGQMVLYCLVPYLVCMTGMLRLVRLRRKEGIRICVATVLCSCICWGILARAVPWLYETSAFGLWIVAFLFFGVFFAKEIYFIIITRKGDFNGQEGK